MRPAKKRQYILLGFLTFVAIVLVVVQHLSAVEVIGLLIIVDFAMKMEYGSQKQGAKLMQKSAFRADNSDSLLFIDD